MHIISGRFKGRTIKRPKGIRPTQDKVRKALFDILGHIEELSFLDLFAGSGAIGLEALSQGVTKVVFVEKDRQCCETIQESIEMLDKKQASNEKQEESILLMDVFGAIPIFFKNQQKFDIIFLDSPYYQDLAKKTLKTLSHYDIVAPNGLIICQHFKRDVLPELLDNLRLIKQAKYGDTVLSFYKR
jgi:16S rRNA (guanine(966)-N(2))-methyltransferase RsmD